MGAGNIMSFVIVALIGAVVFGALIGTIADNTIGISGTGNVTGASATLLDLVPLFVVIGFIVIVLGMVGFKVSGR